MADFARIGTRAELEGKGEKTVALMGKRVAVFLDPDGSLRALEVSCKHQGADLTAGPRNGLIATCPRHGWQYDLGTGECLKGGSPPLRAHAVELRGDEVWVSLFPG